MAPMGKKNPSCIYVYYICISRKFFIHFNILITILPAFSKPTQSYYKLKLLHVIQKLIYHWSLLMEPLHQCECWPEEWAVPIWPTASLVMQQWPWFVTATLNSRCGDVMVLLCFVFLVASVLWVSKLAVRCTSWSSRTSPAHVSHISRSSLLQTVQFTHKSTLKAQLHLARSQWHPHNC